MGTMNFPTTTKLFGANIVPTPTECAGGAAAFTNLFIDWDWSGWVKKQIDWVAGNRIGCNVIGLIGCMDGVHSSAISQSTVNSRWVQLADYCSSLGVYLYPKPCHNNQMSGVTNSACASYVLSILGAVSGYSNIIGCDILTEADGWDDGSGNMASANATRLNAIYTLVKAGTSIPCTYSATLEWKRSDIRTWLGLLSMDYLDFHPYAMNGWDSPIVLSDANYWLTTYPSDDIFFGEAGSPISAGEDAQNTFLKGIANVANSGDARFRGWCDWAVQDTTGVDPSNEWGMYDASWNQRQNKANILRHYTGGYIAKAP